MVSYHKSLLIAAQINATRTNQIKARRDKRQENSKCKLCGDRDKTINYIISECRKLAQKEYKTKHDLGGQGDPRGYVQEQMVYAQDIFLEFSIEICAMLVMKSGKQHLTDGMELPNKDKTRTLGENETYK